MLIKGHPGLTIDVVQRFVMIPIVLLLVSCSGPENESTETELDGHDSTEVKEPTSGIIIPVYQLQQDVPMTMTISTNALKETGFLLVDFTCEGANSSPQIGWDNVPEGTQSIAIVAEDRDFHGGIAAHWIIWNIPSNTTEVTSGISGSNSLPAGAVEGLNSGGKFGYSGPCPPPKVIYQGPVCKNTGFDSNPYVWTIYAIDKSISLAGNSNRDELLKTIDGSILAGGSVDIKYTSKTLMRPRGTNCWG